MPRLAATLAALTQAALFVGLLWPLPTGRDVLFVLLMCGWSALEAASQRSMDMARTGGPALATGLATLTILVLCATTPSAWAWPGGFVLSVLGAGLRGWSIRALGPRFVSDVRCVRQADRVRSGPYRWMRHPSELGLLLLTLGATLLLGSWRAFVVWMAVLVPLVVIRVRNEEREFMGLLQYVPIRRA